VVLAGRLLRVHWTWQVSCQLSMAWHGMAWHGTGEVCCWLVSAADGAA